MNTTHSHVATFTLPNGLPAVHLQCASPVAWAGVAVNAGSRDDPADRLGLAHFVEHTLFKGTTHRRACHILNRMESVGGELNAYTTKEHTMLYSVFPAQYLGRAVELIADLVCHSTFPAAEIERERDVVLEEAAGYRDTPAEAVFDDVEDLLFAGSELGHNILGTEDHVRAITPDDCARYLRSLYTPDNMVLFVVSPEAASRVQRLAERHFGELAATTPRPRRAMPAETPPQRKTITLSHLHQAHTVVATRLPGRNDPRRFALSLLNNMLGGPCMNSLLNVELRERRGYVYNVDSSLTLFGDCGMMQIYMGCDRDDIRSSLHVVDRVTRRLADRLLTPRRLDAAKRQYCGQLLLAADSTEWIAMNLGRSMLNHGAVATIEQQMHHINALTPTDIAEAAALVTLDQSTILTYV